MDCFNDKRKPSDICCFGSLNYLCGCNIFMGVIVMNTKRMLIALFLVIGLGSCEKSSDLMKETTTEMKGSLAAKKDIDFRGVEFSQANAEQIRAEIEDFFSLSSDGGALSEYDLRNALFMENSDGRAVYAIPHVSQKGKFLIISYIEGAGVMNVCHMSYQIGHDGNYTVKVSDVADEDLFTFKSDLDAYKVVSVNDEAGVLKRGPSAEAWGCGMALGAVGTMWGTVVGMACAPAGIAVGLAYAAFSIWACDSL